MNWQKVKNDLLLATSSEFFYKLVGYLVLGMLTRYLDKEQMGEFFFAATLASFFAVLTDLGTNQYLLREVAEKPKLALYYFSEVISLRLPLLCCHLLILNGLIYLLKPDFVTVTLLTSVYIMLEEFYQSFGVLFLGLKRVIYRVVAGVSAKLLLVGLIYSVVTFKGNLFSILACYILADAVLMGLAGLLVWKKIGSFKVVWQPRTTWRILRTSFPFFVLTVLSLIHFKFDTLMLGFMQSYGAVATYEAGFKFLEVSRFLIRPVGMIFFPLCTELVVRGEWLRMQVLLRKMVLTMGVVGCGITLGVLVMAGFIILTVFGSKYSDSIPVLRVLFLSVPALYLEMIAIFLANSLHLEKRTVRVMMIGVIVNITLNSIAIPLWGPLGAAWATVLSETAIAIWLIKLNWQELQKLKSGALVEASPVPKLQPNTIH